MQVFLKKNLLFIHLTYNLYMGTVYLLAEFVDNPRFKIGITKGDVSKRIRELSTGNSNEIILINQYQSENYRKIEGMLHRKFFMNRTKGEWFELTNEQVFSFTEEAKKADELISFLKENNYFYD